MNYKELLRRLLNKREPAVTSVASETTEIMDAPTRCCGNCGYASQEDGALRCRRFPPAFGSIWPTVSKGGWCWEWRFKP